MLSFLKKFFCAPMFLSTMTVLYMQFDVAAPVRALARLLELLATTQNLPLNLDCMTSAYLFIN